MQLECTEEELVFGPPDPGQGVLLAVVAEMDGFQE